MRLIHCIVGKAGFNSCLFSLSSPSSGALWLAHLQSSPWGQPQVLVVLWAVASDSPSVTAPVCCWGQEGQKGRRRPPELRTERAKSGNNKKGSCGWHTFHQDHGEKLVDDLGEQEGNRRKRRDTGREMGELGTKGKQKGQEREREKLMKYSNEQYCDRIKLQLIVICLGYWAKYDELAIS